ncbi:hypothetical protein CAPTEDRAFT_166233 [Capitella teleta]|uniref:SMB domain-containing protein n=1 Tax=Capitella teleta TaxID=283909 RepID=X1ZAL6_CAPTE|nr:hypothetical protein CAPTEDRAFT_166233 [Capitella teleta]|eukprot:ELT90079.1 hypothetical protein CAPTEDRAFT_166233 [Capitella teleta]
MIGLSQSVYGKYLYPGYNIPNNYHYQKKYNYPEPGPDITGKYCETRQPQSCCPGRDDKCTVQILDSLCYCDMFCNRTTNPYPNSASDCCPDFWSTCAYPDSTPPPPEPIIGVCKHEGKAFPAGSSIKINCNECVCQKSYGSLYEWQCDDEVCLIRKEVIDHVNSHNPGWQARNYTFLWGMTLKDGIKYRLGTFKPQGMIEEMSSLKVDADEVMPDEFDAREEWPSFIHPVQDQGNCGASYAFSTSTVAADRLSIHSGGELKDMLSAQYLISCTTDHHQKGCEGGHVDRAWWQLRRVGTVSKDCYPYTSGDTNDPGKCLMSKYKLPKKNIECPVGQGITSKLYQASPPYRIAAKEREIMNEIILNGPVQAVMHVKDDFYTYERGVYKHSHAPKPANYPHLGKEAYHSVRIIGWGTDYTGDDPIKYWLAANTWGRHWGEGGFFRIARGSDESHIESFVVGVWGKVDGRHVRRERSRRSHGRQGNQIREDASSGGLES